MAWSILRCDEVDSTNNVCRTLAAQGADDTAVIARRQTAGKGRLGRSFRSPEGGLYLSVLWRGCPSGQLLTVTPLAAVAVCRAIQQTCGAVCGIKWCNDVVLNGKKLCGILTESSLRPDGGAEWLVVGIGVNVAQTAFPPDIADIAASLAMQGYSVSPDALADVLLEQLTAMRQALPHPQAWRGIPPPVRESWPAGAGAAGRCIPTGHGAGRGSAVRPDGAIRKRRDGDSPQRRGVGAGTVRIYRMR